MKRVVIVDIARPHTHMDEAEKELAELVSLVKTFGGVDVVHIIQHRTKPDKDTFIGSGKVLELTEIVKNKKIDIVILNGIVKPSQIFHLVELLWPANPIIEVWDRVDLILNIFHKHARTAEAKLQIEIAQIEHMGPRMYGLGGTYFSRQAGGIGGRGIGETNIELMKRHWRNQIQKKKKELFRFEGIRQKQLDRRKDNGFKSVSIIGYTNAGKTSLFNMLTGKTKQVKDALFVTLDSTTGILNHPDAKNSILITDTIGFIQNLPAHLIETFKSTLMESINADLLMHVIDIDDEKIQDKVFIVEKIVRELGIESKERIYVFNKTDKLSKERDTVIPYLTKLYCDYHPLFISVKNNEGIGELKKTIVSIIHKTSK